MNNIIAQQENKFKELEESHEKLLDSLEKNENVTPIVGERLLLINSKIDDLREEIEHLQYECDKGEIEKSDEAKERMKEYERGRVFMDKMFPLLFVLFDEMRRVDQA